MAEQNPLDQYGSLIDDEIERIFADNTTYEMYDHLSYFMGFRNEKLEQEKVSAGKRFRPSIALVLAGFYGNVEQVLPAAVSIELFHNFTLVHDDIIDGDTMRRGRPTVWKLFGTNQAINDGDALLIMALEVVTNSDQLSAEQKISLQNLMLKQYRRVMEGQFLDFSMSQLNLGNALLSEAGYLEMIGRKTADLISTATTVSGLAAGVFAAEQQLLHDYGYQIGMVYQMCDDLISIWGTSDTTGKRDCGDIIERKKTLPILWWYKNASSEDKKRMLNLYSEPAEMSQDSVTEVLSLLDAAGTYEVMMERVQTEVNKAKTAVYKLPFTKEEKQILEGLVDVLHVDIKTV